MSSKTSITSTEIKELLDPEKLLHPSDFNVFKRRDPILSLFSKNARENKPPKTLRVINSFIEAAAEIAEAQKFDREFVSFDAINNKKDILPTHELGGEKPEVAVPYL